MQKWRLGTEAKWTCEFEAEPEKTQKGKNWIFGFGRRPGSVQKNMRKPGASRQGQKRQEINENRPKSLQNQAPDPPETAPKRDLVLQTPKIKNNATLLRFCSFFTFPSLQKSSQNRCQNALKISFILETLLEPQKIRFLMLKRRQDGPSKFPFFCKNRVRNGSLE